MHSQSLPFAKRRHLHTIETRPKLLGYRYENDSGLKTFYRCGERRRHHAWDTLILEYVVQ